jgi:hypothetical protein
MRTKQRPLRFVHAALIPINLFSRRRQILSARLCTIIERAVDTHRVAFENWSIPKRFKHPECLTFPHAFKQIICNFDVPSIRKDDRELLVSCLKDAEGRVDRAINYLDVLHPPVLPPRDDGDNGVVFRTAAFGQQPPIADISYTPPRRYNPRRSFPSLSGWSQDRRGQNRPALPVRPPCAEWNKSLTSLRNFRPRKADTVSALSALRAPMAGAASPPNPVVPSPFPPLPPQPGAGIQFCAAPAG